MSRRKSMSRVFSIITLLATMLVAQACASPAAKPDLPGAMDAFAREAAQRWVKALLKQDWDALKKGTGAPFFLEEGKPLKSVDAVLKFYRNIARKKGDAWRRVDVSRVRMLRDESVRRGLRARFPTGTDMKIIVVTLNEKQPGLGLDVFVWVDVANKFRVVGMKD